ncbi:hypothetical protein HHK36_023326 [Tetracentron sinense]|uniref:ATP-dependent RNA helicase n=1 Tax=Tetracentron sinense TaxID=13715 RepID=A0A834YSY6_TETSI|nr:hypothetical protein HHK36_023326 [Tetracentron sinense]
MKDFIFYSLQSRIHLSQYFRLEEALRNIGVRSLFLVQVAVWQETIGPGAFERDLCINSPTGSGKTLAYALPIVQILSTRAIKCLRALVVLPTRDLALQMFSWFHGPIEGHLWSWLRKSLLLLHLQSSIADEILELIKRPKLEAGICYDPEDLWLDLVSSVDILVATPGRLMDHINSTKGFTLEHLCYLICESKLKPLYLVALLQDLRGEKCIVFTSSVEATHRLSTLLNFFGGLQFKIKEYSGLQHQSLRSKTLRAFREGEIRVLVSSDAMTRGMDVEGVKRFKKLLEKADNNSCLVHSIPVDSIESLRPLYASALEKLKESVESEISRRHKVNFKSLRASKGKEMNNTKE